MYACKNIFIFFFLLFSSVLFGQKKLFNEVANRKVILETDSFIYEIEIEYYDDIKTSASKTYTWYAKNKIHHTTGGYEGSLLDGKYVIWDQKKQLLYKGYFKKGLQIKTHYQWHPNGNIEQYTTWKKGILHGKYAVYNQDGSLLETGKYKKGKKHGKVKMYDQKGEVLKVKYCCGGEKQACEKKEKKNREEKINKEKPGKNKKKQKEENKPHK